jgi:hypothetical protein
VSVIAGSVRRKDIARRLSPVALGRSLPRPEPVIVAGAGRDEATMLLVEPSNKDWLDADGWRRLGQGCVRSLRVVDNPASQHPSVYVIEEKRLC